MKACKSRGAAGLATRGTGCQARPSLGGCDERCAARAPSACRSALAWQPPPAASGHHRASFLNAPVSPDLGIPVPEHRYWRTRPKGRSLDQPSGQILRGPDGVPPAQGWPITWAESRRGAPALARGRSCCRRHSPCGCASVSRIAAFPLPAHRTGRADLRQPDLGSDHAFAHGELAACGLRRVWP